METLIEGTFVSEDKSRFLCTVKIDDKDSLCYVPSSCHLSSLISLKGKTVLLKSVKTPNARTKYSLFAVKHRRGYILLNLVYANKVIERELQSRRFSFLGSRKNIRCEYTIGGYRADIYIQDTNTVIEVKTVLANDCTVKFPSMASKRAVKQLAELSALLDHGYKVVYTIVSLSPSVKSVEINSQYQDYYSIFNNCLEKGMTCIAFSVRLLDDGTPEIYKRITVCV